MNRGIIGTCVLVGVAVIGVAALSGMAVGTASATEDTQNASFGADISSFMQASSVEATNEVEEGTFEAALNRTDTPDERRALIEARRDRLQERNDRLKSQQETLGNASDIRKRSIATRVSVGAAGIERSANRTEKVAARNGVDTEQLDEIRSNARALAGPEVAELARSIAGPPGGEPPGANRAGPPRAEPPVGNQSGTPEANRTGPPDDPTPGPSEPLSDATGNGTTNAGDGERGSPATAPGERAPANSSNSTDRSENNGAQQGETGPENDQPEGSDNSSDSNGSAPSGASGTEGSDRGPPDSPDTTSGGPPDSPDTTSGGPSNNPFR